MFENVSTRLIAEVPAEVEWRYLVGETLLGERMIIPALLMILRNPKLPEHFKPMLTQQLEEESHHLKTYVGMLNKPHLKGSQYDRRLAALFKDLPSITLQIFALQGLLEGISLGALQHRLQHWSASPSYDFDQEVYIDELSHVSLSFDHFQHLITAEGVTSPEEFRQVSQAMNEIFTAAFNGSVIQNIMHEEFRQDVDAAKIESSTALANFRENSRREIVQHRAEFLESYYNYA